MIDEFAKEYLHNELRELREAMLWKLDGLREYDARRPLTPTGTNLLGLVKHLSIWESITALAIDSPGHVPWWPRHDNAFWEARYAQIEPAARAAGPTRA